MTDGMYSLSDSLLANDVLNRWHRGKALPTVSARPLWVSKMPASCGPIRGFQEISADARRVVDAVDLEPVSTGEFPANGGNYSEKRALALVR